MWYLRPAAWLIATVLLLPSPPATGQERPSPSNSIRLLVGFTSGSALDLMARPLAQKLSERLGQPVIVENRAGANGTLATEAAARAAPDGRTVLMGTTGQTVIMPLLRSDLPVDPTRDLRPVASIVQPVLVVAVRSDLPVASFADLVAFARSQPGQLAMGSAGNGDSSHLALELLKREMQLNILHVPYRGSGPALQDLLGGRIQLMIAPYIVLKASVEAGRLRALAVTTAKRAASLPAVPTVEEAGGPEGFEVGGIVGLYVAAATPTLIVRRLEAAVANALHAGELDHFYTDQGLMPAFRDSETFAARLAEERVKWSRIVREAGIIAD